ncbi:hypothetical protein BLL42_27595 (plasmid) [Pseudomonas frederiksbergensis]|uniref:Four helix bundle protein n=1 Tax=Pseudomonas frederiksbergensis TaxID=104087 RepID=A0A1J0EUN5_9PSED|nr:hypothetical protein [Pseudomonas frederiksbergensis]APC19500.1 hypothetical protein BLL42_27595 [Pseudomonas frederiksbergensis]
MENMTPSSKNYRSELVIAWASLTAEARSLVESLSERCADGLAMELHRLATAGTDRNYRFGRCRGFIEAAGQRDELTYQQASDLLDYCSRIDLNRRAMERQSK